MLMGTFAFANNIENPQPFYGEITINEISQNQDFEVMLSFNDFNINSLDILQYECTVSVSVTVTASIGIVSVSATVKAWVCSKCSSDCTKTTTVNFID